MRASALRGIRVPAELVPLAIDEFPVLFVAAACAAGETVVTGAEELRVKESDRVATMVGVLRAFGITCEELPDGMVIQGREGAFTPAVIDSRGDHRIAMTAAVLGLHGSGSVAKILSRMPEIRGRRI